MLPKYRFLFFCYASQVSAVSIQFIALTAILNQSGDFTVRFLISSFILVWGSIVFGKYFSGKQFFMAELLLLLIITAWWQIKYEDSAVSFFCFLFNLLLIKSLAIANEQTDSRRYLLQTQTKFNLAGIFLSVGAAYLFAVNRYWEDQVFLFFIAFLFTRMVSLSMISKMSRDEESHQSKSSLYEFFIPFALLITGIMGGWIIQLSGWPVYKTIAIFLFYLFSPVIDVVGFILEQLIPDDLPFRPRFYDASVNQINGLTHVQSSLNQNSFSGQWVQSAFMIFISVIVVYFIYKSFESNTKSIKSAAKHEEEIEEREFLFKMNPIKKSDLKMNDNSLTPIRRTYRKFLKFAGKSFTKRLPNETAPEYIRKIAPFIPDKKVFMEELTDLYLKERYGNKNVASEQERAKKLLNTLIEK
ncbi:DUF4129 domain-containing protein [Thermoactinomyces daqus]|uniref:DUF4129 domain-containing protein n=1 Tax=Thermoactinomyces daqus TaxID=1329516 RepID=A0A7W1XDL5_9BACL|nr:DUF4129 domain-containing protein [Thermoactinomyces daqus]MBA4544629.1 DUF4129 domain-containing protein [Thermoactinomyces daqus]